ncbi:MAG: hypothetical protein H6Q99_328 [Proteobacteria bacterium]|nr:hypothetical protein [Pseudomonadota bacterium]
MKTVYQTDAAGVFVGETVAHESPLEPGVVLIPAGCVESPPPAAAAGHAAMWSGSAWALVDDRRGESWYDGNTPILIDFVGDPIERGYTASAPAATLDDLRAAKIATIVAVADALLGAGAPVTGGLHVALDDGGRADLTAMAATATAAASGAVSWPESYSRGWITIENVRIPLATPTAGLTLAASVGDYYAALVQHRRDLKDAALAAEDAAALDAIDISAGWPA